MWANWGAPTLYNHQLHSLWLAAAGRATTQLTRWHDDTQHPSAPTNTVPCRKYAHSSWQLLWCGVCRSALLVKKCNNTTSQSDMLCIACRLCNSQAQGSQQPYRAPICAGVLGSRHGKSARPTSPVLIAGTEAALWATPHPAALSQRPTAAQITCHRD
jgi:hypothetical protein